MRWDNVKIGKKALAKVALGACLAVGASSSVLAQSLIVRSTGPSAANYPAGRKLESSERVTLKAQDVVTVLDKSGTRVLRGPGTFAMSAVSRANQTASTRLASFITNRGSSRARAGAIRGNEDAVVSDPRAPNLWYLDPRKAGKFCVTNADSLVMWRPVYAESQTASVLVDSGKIELSWNKGNPLKSWPVEALPIGEGKTYKIVPPETTEPVEVSFSVLLNVPEDGNQAAEMLLRAGCQNQLDLLVDTMSGDGASG
jgi:hypothetical protein